MAGVMQFREGKNFLKTKGILDDKFNIWQVGVCLSGSENNGAIMMQSHFFNFIQIKKWPALEKDVFIEGYHLGTLHYLGDGIYQRYLFFARAHPNLRPRRRHFIGHITLWHAKRWRECLECFVDNFKVYTTTIYSTTCKKRSLL